MEKGEIKADKKLNKAFMWLQNGVHFSSLLYMKHFMSATVK